MKFVYLLRQILMILRLIRWRQCRWLFFTYH